MTTADASPAGASAADSLAQPVLDPSPDAASDASAIASLGACPVCGADEGWDPFVVREMMFGSAEPFDYGRCRACGSMVIGRIPADLDRYYPPTYYSLAGREDLEQLPATRRWANGVLADPVLFRRHHRPITIQLAERLVGEEPVDLAPIRRIVAAARLRSLADPVLDVGSGSRPVRLVALRNAGFQRLLAIDPFVPSDSTYAGVPVRKRTIDEVQGPFRFIMFHHSLEHVPDPLGTLRAARRLLRDNGRVQVRTPVMGGELWRRYGTDWVELDAPRHLRVFSRDGLVRLAAQAGFEIETTWFESSEWEMIASEQYRRDLGMYVPGSYFVDPATCGFSEAAIEAFALEARQLNQSGEAGRASFWLRPADA